MKTNYAVAASFIMATVILSGCASPYNPMPVSQSYPANPQYSQPYPAGSQSSPSQYADYGVIDSIQMVQENAGNGVGAGAVVGGVVGGLLGNQVGGGTGRAAATIAGVVGGAMAGNQIEQNNRVQTRDVYQIRVRLNNGGYQTIIQDSINDLRIGNRVRIEGNRVYRY
ncbi:glycine zipper 2TM domain-containing protein [Herminiimonas sp. CN]|uniref:glycine zipper 2TM domain-containing protein n=1 Tax=Herminiimonas sp. CN TaxID=1349818 RepID=UPI000473DD1C|nr:glycine zipper 2TM domain-containing protein [Herminiimonas sp. CN]